MTFVKWAVLAILERQFLVLLEVSAIYRQLDRYSEQGLRMFTSSSFQSHSTVLLHILSQYSANIPVYFINTGYLFPETIAYKDQISKLFKLEVIDIASSTSKNMQKDAQGKLLFASDPDYCCYLNKTQPMETVLRSHDVWINGVRRDQNRFRQSLAPEESAPYGSLRFHPMLEWTPKDIYKYLNDHQIPRNPLDQQGFFSIGCEPCTRKRHPELDEREARWFGMSKFECGLHTDLIKKS